MPSFDPRGQPRPPSKGVSDHPPPRRCCGSPVLALSAPLRKDKWYRLYRALKSISSRKWTTPKKLKAAAAVGPARP